MAGLWVEPDGTDKGWARIDLVQAGGCFIGPDSIEPLPARGGSIPSVTCATIARDPAGDNWYLLARPSTGLRLNGDPLTTGLVQLRHKDLITGPDMNRRLWFSQETLASIVIHAGEPIRCPHCKVSVRQLPDRQCWTYDACPNCGASTAFQTDYAFPEASWYG